MACAPPDQPSLSPSEHPAAVALQIEAARRLGLHATTLDPEFGYLFELAGGGRSITMLGGRSPLNDAVAARIAEDKHYTGLVLARRGFRTPGTERCLRPGYFLAGPCRDRAGTAPARRFAAEHGYPVVVKPNRQSHGREVALVRDLAELEAAIDRIWSIDYIALVQERIAGPDVRLDFLDGEYLLGYERVPLRVRGDGRATLRALLAREDPRYAGAEIWERAEVDPLWRERVIGRGYDAAGVLAAGVEIDFGADILNLNRWARAALLPEIPADWLEHGCAVGRALGLRHFGIDFKGARPGEDPRAAAVIEVNASPLLQAVYRSGHAEAAIAAQVKVLRAVMDFRS
ncbi:MAG: hypothetical protein HY744_16220 [Deltaproteobacteria bacterium]|nr:hypothetical protein [Deltaproteobacteria bacterium]